MRNGACTRSDFMFQVAGPEHGGVFVPVERAAPGEPGQGDADAGTSPVPAEATTTTSTPPVLPLLALGLLIVAGGAALAFSSRRTTHAA